MELNTNKHVELVLWIFMFDWNNWNMEIKAIDSWWNPMQAHLGVEMRSIQE